MKPRYETVEKKGQISGRKIKMKMNENAIAHLQNIFIDMYADPIEATIREILTNARDAHVRAGTDEPVEVELPSAWRSEFIVRDHGDGMDPERFEVNYSQYGASDKRETDDEAGMLGLGAKAPLSYTDQFTVVTVGGGIRTVAIVSRGETGAGEIDILSEEPTDEPNGTEVRIPVRDADEFARRVHQFVRFWKPEWVTVDGEHPEALEGFRVDPDIFLTTELHEDVVVMGGVAYSVGYQHRVGSWNTNAVINVPMGTVDFAPSREEVRYTDRTIETLETAKEFIREAVTRRAQEQVSEQDSHSDALEFYHEEILSNADSRLMDTLYYAGRALPSGWDERIQSYNVRADERTIEHRVNYGSIRDADNAVLVDDYPNKTLSRTNKDKTRKLLNQRGLSPHYVFFADADGRLGAPWTDHVTRISWEDIKAVEIERPQSRGTSNHVSAGTYKIAEYAPAQTYGGSGYKVHEVEAEELIGRPMVYMSPATDFENYRGLASHFGSDITLVILGKNRWDKFNREYADTHHVHEALKFEMDLLLGEMDGTETQWDNVGWSDRWIKNFNVEHADRIADEELAAAIRSAATAQSKIDRYNRISRWYRETGGRWNGLPDMPTASDGEQHDLRAIKQRYPLLGDSSNADALIEYINALQTLAQQTEAEAEAEAALAVA